MHDLGCGMQCYALLEALSTLATSHPTFDSRKTTSPALNCGGTPYILWISHKSVLDRESRAHRNTIETTQVMSACQKLAASVIRGGPLEVEMYEIGSR